MKDMVDLEWVGVLLTFACFVVELFGGKFVGPFSDVFQDGRSFFIFCFFAETRF